MDFIIVKNLVIYIIVLKMINYHVVYIILINYYRIVGCCIEMVGTIILLCILFLLNLLYCKIADILKIKYYNILTILDNVLLLVL